MKSLVSVLIVLWAATAEAHKPSDSYLTLRAEGVSVAGQWDIALRDLDFALGLDADADGRITWGEVRARHGDIAAYALQRHGEPRRDLGGNRLDHRARDRRHVDGQPTAVERLQQPAERAAHRQS